MALSIPARKRGVSVVSEFIETIQAPPGREAQWRDFAARFERKRMRQSVCVGWTPIRRLKKLQGVIAAAAEGVLSRRGLSRTF